MSKPMTPEEVADLLGLKVKTIYNWTSAGRIPHLKLGGRLRFEEAEVQRWMKQFRRGDDLGRS